MKNIILIITFIIPSFAYANFDYVKETVRFTELTINDEINLDYGLFTKDDGSSFICAIYDLDEIKASVDSIDYTRALRWDWTLKTLKRNEYGTIKGFVGQEKSGSTLLKPGCVFTPYRWDDELEEWLQW